MPQRSVMAAEEEVETETLKGSEESTLNQVFARQFEDTRTEGSNTLVNKLREYQDEVGFAAQIAKAQFNQNLGGGSTTAGQFAVSQIDSAYFGYNDWDNAPDAPADGTQDWIDSDTPDNLTGTVGEPIIIGEDAVHVVCGVGTYEDSPKEDKFKFHVNREPKTVDRVEDAWRGTDLQIKWFDTPYIWYEDTEVRAELYSPVAGSSSPYLVGVSFVEGKAARRLSPGTYTGTQTANTIVAQQ